MPCQSQYLEHNAREKESGIVLELLKEIKGFPFDHDNPSYYGKPDTLDADTAKLCAWCKKHPLKLVKKSLELQLWWQRHQRADAKRLAEEKKQQQEELKREQAIYKKLEKKFRKKK